jgi:hypothetical protein
LRYTGKGESSSPGGHACLRHRRSNGRRLGRLPASRFSLSSCSAHGSPRVSYSGAGQADYYLICTLIGGHFFNGFIWAHPGGGWEYRVLMMALFLTYAVRGGGPFSLDGVIAPKAGCRPALSH